jgi:hypothetical protein
MRRDCRGREECEEGRDMAGVEARDAMRVIITGYRRGKGMREARTRWKRSEDIENEQTRGA